MLESQPRGWVWQAKDGTLRPSQRGGAGSASRGGPAHLADLLGKQQQLSQPNAVPGQVVSEATQGYVLHDELYRFFA